MDQSVSPYLFSKDTRHYDAMDQSVFPFVVHIYLEDTNAMDQSVTPYLFRKDETVMPWTSMSPWVVRII